MIEIIEIVDGYCRDNAPLYHSPKNQIRRTLGKTESVYCGGVDGGTVRDADGKCWDFWPTEEFLRGGFRKLCIIPAS